MWQKIVESIANSAQDWNNYLLIVLTQPENSGIRSPKNVPQNVSTAYFVQSGNHLCYYSNISYI